MEMEYTDPSRRGRVIILLGLILAVLAGAAAFFLLNQARHQAPVGIETQTIVVAARDVPARKVLEESDLELREVAVDATGRQGVFLDTGVLIGLIPSVPILSGQPVYANMLAGQAQGSGFAILDPGETVAPDSVAWRAVTISVPDDRATGGLIQAGQRVDVIATIPLALPADLVAAGRYYSDRSTKVIFQDMVVLAKTATAYVVKAALQQAEELSHLQATGAASFSLLLRPDADVRRIDDSILGTTTNRIIAKYGLPLPEVYPPGSGPLTPQTGSPTPTPGSDATAPPDAIPSASPAP